jgi:hypothetical protein
VKPNESWKVMPHGPLTQLADNLYTVTGQLKMPLGETSRRMTVVKLANGTLAIYSAIALDDAQMQRLEALGTPSVLVVPSGIHRLDARPWKDRYPELVVVAPAGARDKVGEVVGIDRTSVDLGDPRVRVFAVPGTDERELAMVVDKTLVLNDLIFNLPRYKGVLGWGLRLLGFGPGRPTIPKLVAMNLVADEPAMKAQLRRWANEGFERILVAHGAQIDNPRQTLLALAA